MIYLELFLTFFKIGAFTFGGGYAMLPLMQEAVLQKGWLTLEEVVNFIAVSESTPGPFAINMATYVGMMAEGAGILGSVCATLGIVLPSFIIILLIIFLVHTIYYTIFDDENVIIRSTRIVNKERKPIYVEKASSLNLDLDFCIW